MRFLWDHRVPCVGAWHSSCTRPIPVTTEHSDWSPEQCEFCSADLSVRRFAPCKNNYFIRYEEKTFSVCYFWATILLALLKPSCVCWIEPLLWLLLFFWLQYWLACSVRIVLGNIDPFRILMAASLWLTHKQEVKMLCYPSPDFSCLLWSKRPDKTADIQANVSHVYLCEDVHSGSQTKTGPVTLREH